MALLCLFIRPGHGTSARPVRPELIATAPPRVKIVVRISTEQLSSGHFRKKCSGLYNSLILLSRLGSCEREREKKKELQQLKFDWFSLINCHENFVISVLINLNSIFQKKVQYLLVWNGAFLIEKKLKNVFIIKSRLIFSAILFSPIKIYREHPAIRMIFRCVAGNVATILDMCIDLDLTAGNARVSMIHAASGATPPRLTCRTMCAPCVHWG